jgi:hypothetical protein
VSVHARYAELTPQAKVYPGARLYENSIFQKCASIKSTAYFIKNASIRGFHTVWRRSGRLPQQAPTNHNSKNREWC